MSGTDDSGRAPTQDDLPERLRGEWTAKEWLSRGGQARPIKVRHATTQAWAVLKRPIEPHTLTDENRKRLRQEIETLSAHVQHANVVRLIDSDPDDEAPWYLSPLGVPLPDYWKRWTTGKTLDERFEEARRIVWGLLDGLAAVHDADLIHRDIKPGNVILSGDDPAVPTLIDFGVVFGADFEPITDIDKRIVANRTTSGPDALYGLEAKKSWDCLGLAYVWAWLLRERMPKYHRFHWRHHRFLPHPHCERVRAVFAVCSSLDYPVADAHAMMALAEKMGLPRPGSPEPEQDDIDLNVDDALETVGDLEARRAKATERLREAADTAIPVLAPIYESVRERFIALVDQVRERGKGRLTLLCPDRPSERFASRPIEELLREACAEENRSNPTFISVNCGEKHEDWFHVSLRFVTDESYIDQGYMPFSFHIELSHPHQGRAETHQHAHDGSGTRFRQVDGRLGAKQMSDDELLAEIGGWLTDKGLWSGDPNR
jgi:hypothetical protein